MPTDGAPVPPVPPVPAGPRTERDRQAGRTMYRCPTCVAVLPDPRARWCPACAQDLRRRRPRLLGEDHRIGSRPLPIDRALAERLHARAPDPAPGPTRRAPTRAAVPPRPDPPARGDRDPRAIDVAAYLTAFGPPPPPPAPGARRRDARPAPPTRGEEPVAAAGSDEQSAVPAGPAEEPVVAADPHEVAVGLRGQATPPGPGHEAATPDDEVDPAIAALVAELFERARAEIRAERAARGARDRAEGPAGVPPTAVPGPPPSAAAPTPPPATAAPTPPPAAARTPPPAAAPTPPPAAVPGAPAAPRRRWAPVGVPGARNGARRPGPTG